MHSRTIQALLLFIGTIIGVGVFALPYTISRAGLMVGAAELVVLTVIVTLIHLMYGDISLSVPGSHQMPGYVSILLGRYPRAISSASSILGLLGSLVAYILVGSLFLATLLQPILGSSAMPVAFALFFLVGAVTFFYDNSFSTELNGIFTVLLVIFMAVLIVLGLSAGGGIPSSSGGFRDAALPYGVILFALAGASVVPRVKETLAGAERRNLGTILLWGTIIPAVFYLFFTLAVLSSSDTVTRDAIGGLGPRLGSGAVILGAAIGFLATITSFVGIGLTLRETLNFDFRISKTLAWLSALFVPFLLVFAGVSDFVRLISLIGACTIGVDSILIAAMWQRLKAPKLLSFLPPRSGYIVAVFFLIGIVYELSVFLGVL